jgi:hypothetical protein
LLVAFAWQTQAQQVKEIIPVGFSGSFYQKDIIRSDFRGFKMRCGWWIDGITMLSQNAHHSKRGGTGGDEKSFILSNGEKIISINGTYGGQYGDYIYSIQFHTNRRSSPVYGEKRGNRNFNLKVPIGNEFAGISTKYGDHLNAIGMLYKEKKAVNVVAPKLYSPAVNATLDNGCTTKADPTKWNFSWYKVPGATRYWFQVKNRSSTNPLINVYATTNSYAYTGQSGSHIARNLTSGWTWKVNAEVNGVLTGWSEERAFTVEAVNTDCANNTVASKPKLYSPAVNANLDNGCTTKSSDPTKWDFSWYQVSGVTRYWFYAKNKNSANALINVYATTNSYAYTGQSGSHIANNLTSGWTWRVNAEVNGVLTGWSEERAFTVEAVNTDCLTNNNNGTSSSTLNLYLPAINAELDNGCTTNISDPTKWNFSWYQVPRATRYWFYAKNKNSANALINVYTTTNSYAYTGQRGSVIMNNLTSGWSWRVNAEVDGVWTGWSGERAFTVEATNTDCK